MINANFLNKFWILIYTIYYTHNVYYTALDILRNFVFTEEAVYSNEDFVSKKFDVVLQKKLKNVHAF